MLKLAVLTSVETCLDLIEQVESSVSVLLQNKGFHKYAIRIGSRRRAVCREGYTLCF